jgi:hypothetical protein
MRLVRGLRVAGHTFEPEAAPLAVHLDHVAGNGIGEGKVNPVHRCAPIVFLSLRRASRGSGTRGAVRSSGATSRRTWPWIFGFACWELFWFIGMTQDYTLFFHGFAVLAGLVLGSLGTLALQGLSDASGQGAASGPQTSEEAAGEAEADQGTPLEDAVSVCGLDTQSGASLGDSGRSLHLETEGEEDFSGLAITDVDCVLAELEVPDHVLNQINSTRALDGRLSAEWEGMSATWSYHPRSGLDLQLVLE